MIGTNLAITTKNYAVAGGVAYDADAQAYFNANTTIISAADKNAINTFYLGLKSDGIYTKIKAMYLPIWGSASASKWNLVNPLDTNAAYRLTFSTGWTYTAQGILGNGTSAYADTNLVPSTSGIQLYKGHLSAYSQTSAKPTAAADFFLGDASNTGTWNNLEYFGLGSNNTQIYMVQHSSVSASDYAVNNTYTNRSGMWIGTRTSATASTLKLIRNGTPIASASTSSSGQALNIWSVYLGALRNMTHFSPYAQYFTNSKISFASIGDGFTDAEALNFSNRVNTLMTYFGINVY